MNQVQRGIKAWRRWTLGLFILGLLISPVILVSESAGHAAAAPATQLCGPSTPCPTPFLTPTPACPARTASSKAIGDILVLTGNGVRVERVGSGSATFYKVTFDLQPTHAFKQQIGRCVFNDGVVTRSGSTNIQQTTTTLPTEQQAITNVYPIDPAAAVGYRFRLEYEQNIGNFPNGNPKYRSCTLGIPGGLAAGQVIWLLPTNCGQSG